MSSALPRLGPLTTDGTPCADVKADWSGMAYTCASDTYYVPSRERASKAMPWTATHKYAKEASRHELHAIEAKGGCSRMYAGNPMVRGRADGQLLSSASKEAEKELGHLIRSTAQKLQGLIRQLAYIHMHMHDSLG